MDPLSLALSVAGGVGSFLTEQNASEKQYEYNKQLQEAQFEFNRTEAAKAHQRALEMNKITYQQNSIQNKVGQMKEAGLNPALMYGGGAGNAGGAGSASTTAQAAGGAASSVSRPNTAQSLGIAMQLAQLKANVDLTKAQENLANTQAEKLAGADTNKINAEIQNLGATREGQDLQNAYQRLENDIKGLTMQYEIAEAKSQAEYMARRGAIALEEYTQAVLKTEVDQATKEARIKQAIELAATQEAEKNLKLVQGEYTEEQKNRYAEQLQIQWANVANGKESNENAANKLAQDREIWNEQKDENTYNRRVSVSMASTTGYTKINMNPKFFGTATTDSMSGGPKN